MKCTTLGVGYKNPTRPKMQTFGRLLSVLTFLLSLGFIAQALPTTPRAAGLAVRDYSPAPHTPSNGGYTKPGSGSEVTTSDGGKTLDLNALIVVDLKAKVDAHVAAIAKVNTAVDLDVKIKALVVDIKAVVAVLVNAKVNLDVDAKLKLAVAIHAMIIAIVKVCATVVVKIGVAACVSILAQLDVAIHSLILVLNVAIDGFLTVLVKLFVDIDADVAAAIKVCGLNLVVKILAIIKVVIN
ncbi:hypothetical protein OPQ81_002803 [Rhizoctonia solani]|nr:hypothetical protein OPQ81_002803 [Rhizoctonia solani]